MGWVYVLLLGSTAAASILLNNFAGMGLVLLDMGLGRIDPGKLYPRSLRDCDPRNHVLIRRGEAHSS
jgi:hypothetical protein